MKRLMYLFLILVSVFIFLPQEEAVAACAHEWQEITDSKFTYKQDSGNSAEHWVTCHNTWTCMDCGTVTYDEVSYTEHEAHSFSNNKCTKCGYKKTCSHEWQEITDSKFTYKQDSGNSAEHWVTCHNTWTCMDCGTVTYDGPWYTEHEAHSFSNNKCTKCGYKKSCDHATTTNNFLGKQYAELDDEYHEIAYHFQKICASCNAVVKDDLWDFSTELHTMGSNGKCTKCGYQESCDHFSTEMKLEEKYYVPVDETYHQIGLVYQEVCTSCYDILRDDVLDYEVERHTLDRNGNCTKCRYEKEDTSTSCDHYRTKEVEGNKSYKSVEGNNTHHQVVTTYKHVCTNCNMTISTEDRVETALHSFKGNTCTVCGYSTQSNASTYSRSTTNSFVDGKLKASSIDVEIEYRSRNGGDDDIDAVPLDGFSDLEMKAMLLSNDYLGLKYTIQLPELAYDRTYLTTIVFRAPNGFTYTVYNEYETYARYPNAKGRVSWYCIGEGFFDEIFYEKNYIPSGEYYVDLYWDGMWVNTTPFYVVESEF